jgi:hypothetical protein
MTLTDKLYISLSNMFDWLAKSPLNSNISLLHSFFEIRLIPAQAEF